MRGRSTSPAASSIVSPQIAGVPPHPAPAGMHAPWSITWWQETRGPPSLPSARRACPGDGSRSGAGAVVEVGGEGGVAPSPDLPAQRRIGGSQRVAVQLGAGMVKARNAAPDITWLGGLAFGLDPQVADDIDALARRGVLQGDAGRPD